MSLEKNCSFNNVEIYSAHNFFNNLLIDFIINQIITAI